MRIWIFCLLNCLMTYGFSVQALQSRDLIREAEALYRDLEPGDRQRQVVALRVADLSFDAAIEIEGDAKATAAEMRLVETYRDRSEALYRQVLPNLKGAQAVRVRFQISRLRVFAGRVEQAVAIWEDLVKQKEDPNVRRESALQLAEQYELSQNREKLTKAVGLYNMVLATGAKPELNSYLHYRLAWSQFRLGETEKAIALLQTSMEEDKNGTHREDRLRDLALFLSRSSRTAPEAVKLLESYGRGDVAERRLSTLAEAYLAADRRDEFAFVTTKLDARHPSLDRQIALLDARHDLQTPDQTRKDIERIRTRQADGVKFRDSDAEKLSRDRLYRLIVIWDGQIKANRAEYRGLLTAATHAMIEFWPTSDEANRALTGWITVQKASADYPAKLTQLLPAAAKGKVVETQIRRELLEIARKKQDWVEVAAQADHLMSLVPASERREIAYQKGKAAFELKQMDVALPLFLEVAASTKVDELSRFSQDLALDILDERRDYAQVVNLVENWRKVRPDLASVGEKARFEIAAVGQDANGLRQFRAFCEQGKFLPQSCENAETLARRLGETASLLAVLKAQGKNEELSSELERLGRFGESARLREARLKADSKPMDRLRVALLYEVQGDLKSRDRILRELQRAFPVALEHAGAEEQRLFLQTFAEAGLLRDEMLKWNWNEDLRFGLATRVAEASKAKAANATALLLARCDGSGRAWQDAHLARLAQSYNAQKRMRFLGRDSERRFAARVEALKKFADLTDCYAKGAPSQSRAQALGKVGAAYQELVTEIRSSPIPKDLDSELREEIEAKINEIAQPFEEAAERWLTAAGGDVSTYAAWNFKSETPSETKPPLKFDWRAELESLQRNPDDATQAMRLKTHFEERGSSRLAAYFDGRAQGLGKKKETVKQ